MAATTAKPKDPLNPTLEEAADIVRQLVADFDAHAKHYLSASYHEAEARKDFIDKFLTALGWDVDHVIQKNPYQQEVKVEPSVPGAMAQRHADYALALAPHFDTRLLYVEAKKPCADIATPDNYFQVIRYANQPGNPIGVLTSFFELHVIDCRFQANIDTATQHALQKYQYTDFKDPEKFARVFYLIARPEVAKGSIDAFVGTLPKPKGRRGQKTFLDVAYKPIDERLLETLDELRRSLALNLKLRNPQLDSSALTELTQRILDRLVFIRFLEDKLIEQSPIIPKLGQHSGCTAWQDFLTQSRRLDGIYNGIVFRRHGILDEPRGLAIDEKVFGDILEGFDFHKSKYLFNEIPIHILGSMYERFLGNVIVATEKRATLEPKPEVQKARGVHYTPKYIVDYIVQNTVGKLIDGKTPDEIAKMRFADIACGSGSFLLGAYDHVLRYVTSWYRGHPRRIPKGATVQREGVLRLSLQEKSRILTDNIYGVDIDPQAVEVAQLSLYLKLLEEETTASARQYTLDFHRPLLPSLAENIKFGNSLIGPDYSSGRLTLDPEQMERVNPFDWKQGFPDAMNAGGFDCIIGNPPYRRELDYKNLMDDIARTPFGMKFRAPRMDLWYYFVHRGLELLKTAGTLSFIVNAYWTTGTGAQKLIAALRDTAHIDEIFSFGKLQVFQNVAGQHMIVRVTNKAGTQPTIVKLAASQSQKTAEPFVTGIIPPDAFTKTSDQLFRDGKIDIQPPSDALLSKLERWVVLANLGIVRQGIAENPACINRKTSQKYGNRYAVGEGVFALRPDEVTRLRLPKRERDLLRPYHDLCDIGRYYLRAMPSLSLIYSTRTTCPVIDAYPTLCAHLTRFRPIMSRRRETQKGANCWWHLHWPRDEAVWKSAKILSVQMGRRPAFVPATRPVYVPFSVNVFVPFNTTHEHLNYIAGVLNSRLLWKWYQHHAKRRGTGLEINGNVLARTPIRAIDFSDAKDVSQHDRMVSLVDNMSTLHASVATATSERQSVLLQRQIDGTDGQIDRLVYDLYGLTAEEIAVVEGATA